MRHIVDYPRRSGDFRQLIVICRGRPFKFPPQHINELSALIQLPATEITALFCIPVICRGDIFQNTTVKAVHFNIQAGGQNRQQVKRHSFSASTLSHRRFHHTDTFSLVQKPHQSPLFAVKCTVMVSLASSGNPSQRHCPVPLCSQSSCSIRQFCSSSSTPFCRCISQRVNAIFSGDTTPRPAAFSPWHYSERISSVVSRSPALPTTNS